MDHAGTPRPGTGLPGRSAPGSADDIEVRRAHSRSTLYFDAMVTQVVLPI